MLLYHGSLDIICHYTGAQEMLVKANWTGKDEYHQSKREAFWAYNEAKCLYNLVLIMVYHIINSQNLGRK